MAHILVHPKQKDAQVKDNEQIAKCKTAHGTFVNEFGPPKSIYDIVEIPQGVKRNRKNSSEQNKIVFYCYCNS